MDVYQAFFSLKPGVGDLDFAGALARFLDHLKAEDRIVSWRLMRRKLGLGPAGLGDFHLMIETRDLAQLDAAFTRVSSRTGPVEDLHFDVNSRVSGISFLLTRDFPDPHRESGAERF